MRQVILGMVACGLVLVGLGTLGADQTAKSASPRRLTIVPFTAVHVEDAFWAPRIRTNRERSIPHNLKWCEETGRISNFAKA
ncbi:MAG: glycoside hydrolase family 127 protein, partial [Thermogutta sp.]|uniref:hypothetical protein n=1 Tax=Thermogutta sp. TaxID=1962930 RepID=UPI0019A6741F